MVLTKYEIKSELKNQKKDQWWKISRSVQRHTCRLSTTDCGFSNRKLRVYSKRST